MDLADREHVTYYSLNLSQKRVINLAAQAGVRYSIKNPHSYINSNIVGFTNILGRAGVTKWLIWYASSSSVYGLNKICRFMKDRM